MGCLYKNWVKNYGEEVANEKMKEYKEKMRKSCFGDKNGFYGKFHTDETKKKLTLKLTGKPAWNKGIPNPNISGELNPAKLPENKIKISNGVKNSYTDELRDIRSKHFKTLMNKNKTKYRLEMEKRGLWRKRSEIPEFEKYKTMVRTLSQESYSTNIYTIDKDRKRGRKYHLDHIYSIAKGFENNIDPKIISHPCNLRIIPHSLNESKFIRCDIGLEELMEKIDEFNKRIG